MDWKQIILSLFTIALFAIGLAGIVAPLLPGIPLIWLGAVIYGFFTGFKQITFLVLSVFTVLMVFSLVFDYLCHIYGAKKFGAGKWGIAGTVIGMMLGLVIFGLLGMLTGAMLGAVIGELLSGKSKKQAFKAGLGTIVGYLGGVLVKFIIGLIMIGIFVWKVF